jgi:hypothetical protein
MKRINIALVLAALVTLVATGTVLASHTRPRAASPLTYRLVPAFKACDNSNSNGTHGAPFDAFPVCSPPVQESPYLTWAAGERPAPFNLATTGTGLVTLKVTCVSSTNPPVESGETPPCPTAGNQEDMLVTISVAGVRCQGATGQGSCAGGAASLYDGKVRVQNDIQITDHFNSVSGSGCSATTSCVGTVQNISLSLSSQCSSGACNIVTTWDSVVGGGGNIVEEGKRQVYELGQLHVYDGGLNGTMSAAGGGTTCPPACNSDDSESLFLVQGSFAP